MKESIQSEKINSMEDMTLMERFRNIIKRPTVSNCITPLVGIIFILILGNLVVPGFTSVKSIINYATLATMTIFACVGQFLVIVSGKGSVDLSIGALISIGAAFGGAMAGGTTTGFFTALLVMIILGGLTGMISGASLQYLQVPAMVITMSMGSLLDSGYIAVTKGKAASGIPELLTFIGTGSIGGIRILLILAVIVVILVELVMRKTDFGKGLYLVGTSEKAAQFSGIQSNKLIIIAYIASGVVSAIAGFVLLGITGSMQAGMGEQYTMLAIASCVIGGINLAGGKGTFVGCAFGAVMLTILNSFLTVVSISEGARNCIKGIILLIILIAYGRGSKLRA